VALQRVQAPPKPKSTPAIEISATLLGDPDQAARNFKNSLKQNSLKHDSFNI
jgi:hypothetical protein